MPEWLRHLYPNIAFAPETGGGDGAEGGDGDGDGTPAGESDPGQGAGGESSQTAAGDGEGGEAGTDTDPPSAYRPDGLPDDLVGATDQETIDKLYARTQSLRKSLGQKGNQAPKEPTEYSLDGVEIPEGVHGFQADELSADPVYQTAQQAAHKAGMSVDMFKTFMGSLMGGLREAGVVDTDDGWLETQIEALGGSEQAKTYVDTIERWGQGLVDAKKLDDDAFAAMEQLMQSAGGIKLLNALRVEAGEKAIPIIPGQTAGGAKNKDELYALKADPRYGQEAEYTNYVEEEFRKFFGGGRSGTSQRRQVSY